MGRIRFLLIIFLFSILPLGAEEISWPEDWRWGVAAWENRGVSPEYQYILRSMPQRLLRFASSCANHEFSREEAWAFAAETRRKALEKLEEEVSSLRKELDAMLFDPAKGPEDRRLLNEKWTSSRRKLEEARLRPPSYDDPPGSLPLILAEKNREEDLLSPLTGPSVAYAGEVEYLAAGSLEEVEGILLFSFRLYSFVEKKDLFHLRRAYLPEEADRFFDEAGVALTEALLGRSWGALTVESEVPATLSLNGEVVGRQYAHIPFLSPGYYTLEAVAPGYQTVSEEVLLLPREEKRVVMKLEKGEWLDLSVLSQPSGADLFLGSRWLGVTPWRGEIPPEYNRITLRKAGYREVNRFLTPREGADWTIPLRGAGFDSEKHLDIQRNRFYRSLGAFFLAIPGTALLYSTSQITGQALANEKAAYGENDETERLRRIASIGFYGWMGSLFIDGALFVNMVIDAVNYVKAAGIDFKE